MCGIYFLASVGLGGNIPIDATIALEFMPQSKRSLVALMSMWQPIGVTVASAISYGTTARYRCDVTLPACSSDDVPCCTVASNMGWRYNFIIIGGMTLLVFGLRFFVFKFHESPKFLVSKGREQEAIDVLHKIAKFNGQPPPTLTIEQFREIDREEGLLDQPIDNVAHAKGVVVKAFKSISHLKGIFGNRLESFIFFLLALAYMVNPICLKRCQS